MAHVVARHPFDHRTMRSARRTPHVSALALALGLAACADSAGPGTRTPERIQALPRTITGAERTAIDASTRFGLALLRTTADSVPADSNNLVSPLSASVALGMAMVGARDSTFEQMRRALGFTADDTAAIRAGYRDLLPMLARLDDRVTYTLANHAWVDRGFPLVPTFLPQLDSVFAARASTADFRDEQGTLRTINDWVRDRTNGRIPSILEALRPNDVFVLANALYFKGRWREQFDAAKTADAPFTIAPGRTTTVRMMQARANEMRAGRVGATRVVELPYGGGAWVMTIVMPPAGELPALVRALDEGAWRRYVQSLDSVLPGSSIELPRFRAERTHRLPWALARLGMRDAFDDNAADFRGISPLARTDANVYLSQVAHRVFVDVNEEGTEAAAATAVVGAIRVSAATTHVRIDAPFLFAIRERFSGTLLVLGTISVPMVPRS
jgi:serpin B